MPTKIDSTGRLVELVYRRCSTKFYAASRYSGKVKYCMDCRVDVYDENQEVQRQRRKVLRGE